MTAALTVVLSIFSVLMPQKMWFAPSQPITITIKSEKDATLVLTDFTGALIASKASADVAAGKSADVKTVFPDIDKVGTYILYAIPKGAAAPNAAPKDFLGTPVVINALKANDPNDPSVMVFHVEPLRYVKMTTTAGPMTMIFYYDAAPHTADSFLQLCSEGFYDGLTFHRVHPGMVIQGGDPQGSGMGGAGYHVEAEFNAHHHDEGVLSMARSSDVNSAGSQFFISLGYNDITKKWDGHYTIFGKVLEGFDTTVKKMSATAVDGERPITPQVIEKAEVLGVTADSNPYAPIMTGEKAQ